ncbi:uncharacterized protein GIQ15_04372 [Arthroderma uncinatum]|uniref:uncharacterized protein n=1 Tax=Arthroderma uncinatum TaxID=74035 RepID=UPI00144AC28D|nr:uncharacterized protein GIQ15_04372 [Arthroderma uncinatum]KAF3481613.1 hypothetical protein GIQ15_04372 [Arthroderma uncinatum]
MEEKRDHWSAEAYSASASFVPKLTETVLQYLSPQQHDKVLDVGCGDGKFTSKYVCRVASVLGIDSSPAMIEAAKRDFGADQTEFRVVDCRYLDREDIVNGTWDKVVSNAALHWILTDSTTRVSVLKAIFDSLRPGGAFVFEMGGHGNVPEVHTALLATLVHHGLSIEGAREASPWFFPSESWMRETLESIGFIVERLEVEYRPTRLTVGADGGIEGWVKLMGAPMLEALDPARREDAARWACALLETIITKEDGSRWLGYVRLRGVAMKPQL